MSVAKRADCPLPKSIGPSTVQSAPWEVAAQAGELYGSLKSAKDVVAPRWQRRGWALFMPPTYLLEGTPKAGLEGTWRSHLTESLHRPLWSTPTRAKGIEVGEDYFSIVKPLWFGVFFVTAIN